MASSDVQRKLTAILCADVVGYSRLMGENEQATLRTLTDYRQVFSDHIDKFRGRVEKRHPPSSGMVSTKWQFIYLMVP